MARYDVPVSDEKKLVSWLLERWRNQQQDRSEWMNTLVKIRARLDGLAPDQPALFKGASNFSPPIGATFLRLFLARAAKILLVEPTDFLQPENAFGSQLLSKVRAYLKASFREGQWVSAAREWMRRAAADGVSVLWAHWDRHAQPRLEVVEGVAHALIPSAQDDLARGRVLQELLTQHFDWTVQQVQMLADWEAQVICVQGSAVRAGTVKLTEIIGQTATLEWDFDDLLQGVKPEIVDIEKVTWSPHARDPEREGIVTRQFTLTWARLQEMQRGGEVVLPNLEKAKAFLPPPQVKEVGPELVADGNANVQDEGIAEERRIALGVVELYASTPSDSLEILEVIAPYDYRGKGAKADCIFWVLLKADHLLRATPLYRLYRHGRRPGIFLFYDRSESRPFPRGIPSLLEQVEDEIYTFHNLTADSAVWAMSVFGFFKPQSANRYQDALKIEPFTFFPLLNPDGDVKIVTINPNFQIGLQFSMFLTQLARDLIGVSEQSMGRPPKRSRGVYDTLALMQESNVRFDYVLTEWGEAFGRALTLWWKLEQQFSPMEKAIQIPGDDGLDRFEQAPRRQDIARCEYSLYFNVNPNALNPATAGAIYQTLIALTTNPGMMQLGLTDRGGIWNAIDDWCRSRGIPDTQRYFPRPPEAVARRQTPDVEWQALLRDEAIHVHPADDDESHSADHMMRVATPEDEAALGPQRMAKWVAHIKAHQQAITAKKIAYAMAVAAQQEGGGQPQNQGAVPVPSGGGETAAGPTRMPQAQSSAAGAATPASTPVSSLEPEDVTLASNAGTGS